MSEGQHIPYAASALPVPHARSVLVLAPHPDDETIGCGGCAALYAQAGIPVRALVMTDGSPTDLQVYEDAEQARKIIATLSRWLEN